MKEFLEQESKSEFAPLNADFKARTSLEDYIKHVNLLKEEIQYGNITKSIIAKNFMQKTLCFPTLWELISN